MKFIAIIILSALVYAQGCSQIRKQDSSSRIDDLSVHHISQSDVEKILGHPAVLTESSVEKKAMAAIYRYTYTATDSATAGNRTAHLYYMFEVYNDEVSAKKTFGDLFSGNQSMSNIKKLDMGDEAWHHTDNENFEMIIVRKSSKIIRLKVNKLTSTMSSEELFATAEKIANTL